MEKRKSILIPEDDLIVKTETIHKGNEVFNKVHLTMISTGLVVEYESNKGQLYTYNKALKRLEKKVCEKEYPLWM